MPRPVHLVGSIPLDNAETVFRRVSHHLGEHVARIPDGETGIRKHWIGWQLGKMGEHAFLEAIPEDPAAAPARLLRLKPDTPDDAITFGPLGYAEAARNSWPVFERLQADGVIPAGVRFQVSLPTPLAPVTRFLRREDRHRVEGAYHDRMLTELAEILAAIPHDRLAIQWDVAIEFAILEGVWPAHFDAVESGILSRLTGLSGQVSEPVHLGFHLCYGDYGHRHFVEPADTARLVRVANALNDRVDRAIQWFHMPVPRNRTDAAYFQPLADLELSASSTTLFLGLLHRTDGLDGARQRAEAARTVRDDFGIATECGFGRRPPETIADLLTLYARAATAL